MVNYGSPELEFDSGKGSYLFTASGEKYLDFAMGIAVNCLGHCHPVLVSALKTQADKLWHTSNHYRITQSEKLAKRLTELTFADRVFFCNSGTEAVECGFKMMRRYHHDKGDPQRKRIIAMTESFHGRTLAPVAASANPVHCEGFLLGDSGFDQVAFGDINALKNAVNDETAGVVIEPIQGEGGIRLASAEYLTAIRKLCDQHGILLMFDEVQSGLARSGQFYAYQLSGVIPDILASAKGLGGGFPIGACLATEAVAKCMVLGTHGSTFGGNPLAAAVANAVLDVVTAAGFMERMNSHAQYLRNALQQLVKEYPKHLHEVSGAGLMIGLKSVVNNGDLVKRLAENRMLVVKAGNNGIRLLPALNISQSEIDEALAILKKVLSTWS